MKASKIFAALFMMMSAICVNAQEAKLSIDDFTIEAGESKEISVNLSQDREENGVCSFQISITIPEGLEFDTRKNGRNNVYVLLDKEGERFTDHSVSSGFYADDKEQRTLNIVVTSMTQDYIFGKEGKAFSFFLKAAEDLGMGNREITCSSIELFVPEGKGGITIKQDPFTTEATTAINEVKADAVMENAVLYNMAGQRVSKAYKGVVISNGKKYMNK